MIPIGIFARTFPRPTIEETLDAIVLHGIGVVQFNMSCAGLESLPDEIAPSISRAIGTAMATRGLTVAAVSGTFNMISPDTSTRRAGLQRLAVLASSCATMGTDLITLSTGTRDPHDVWRRHPENDSGAAWTDLVVAMSRAARIAQDAGITVAFEPELSNVVNSARKARHLLDEVRSPRVKVVIDPSNLFHAGELRRMRSILDEAFDLLGPDIVLAHAKDLTHDGAAGDVAAGQGVLDYDHYLARLTGLARDVPLILHSLRESQVDSSVCFLVSKGAVNPATPGRFRAHQ